MFYPLKGDARYSFPIGVHAGWLHTTEPMPSWFWAHASLRPRCGGAVLPLKAPRVPPASPSFWALQRPWPVATSPQPLPPSPRGLFLCLSKDTCHRFEAHLAGGSRPHLPELRRCCIFYKLKARPGTSKVTAYFAAVVWDHTCSVPMER